MRVQLVTNPESGGGTQEEEVRRALERHGARCGDDDPERIVVAGGDGTLAGAAARAAELGVPLAVIPTGTANDFARAWDLPEAIDEAAELAVGGAAGTAHDLGFMDDRPFLNLAAAGLHPAAARRAAPLKRVLGPLAYPVGGALAGMLDDPVDIAVAPHFEGAAWQMMIAVTGAFGGGTELEVADPVDGHLDLVVVPAGSRLALARLAPAMRRGRVPGAIHARADAFTVDVGPGTSFAVDGEEVVAAGQVSFTVTCGAFRLVSARHD
jgi:diacylglycerol kinase family enzyme